MKMANGIVFLLVASISPAVLALDSACKPILDASEKKMNQAGWHSIATLTSGTRMESMKADGGFFRNVGGTWMKSPVNYDTAEKDMIAQMKSGEVKLTLCQSAGSEMLDGMPVTVFTSRIEMKGAPAEDSRLYIGKSDGLPYKQSGKSVQVVYKYKNILAPKI